ncbi:MAG: SMC-Scp complex subunit ScpB [Trichlorobacter sp.]|jgi:segregation and condensation protein B|nr:SMC-Scp complex subunit ScpB [Trichlorobacter sp.]
MENQTETIHSATNKTPLPMILEALIFISETPVSLDKFCELLPEYERLAIKNGLKELQQGYEARGAGIRLSEVAGGWQLRTVTELSGYIARLAKNKPARFTQSALETLAIVAYRQPITRQEVEYLRGVDSGAVLKTLLEKRLIKILGKKEIPGRPLIYGTSREFLEVFNLKDLNALPTLREVSSLDETVDFEVQEELPLATN